MGGVIGTLIPVPFVGTAIGAFVGGMGGDAVGGMIYDMIFGSKKDTDPGDTWKDEEKKKGSATTGTSKTTLTRSTYTSGPAGGSGDQLTMARNLMRDLNLT